MITITTRLGTETTAIHGVTLEKISDRFMGCSLLILSLLAQLLDRR